MIFKAVLLLVALSAGDTSDPSEARLNPGGGFGEFSEASNLDAKGGYHFFYQQLATLRSETGALVDVGGTNEHMSVSGRYSYVAPDNTTYTVEYVADDQGYRANITSETEFFKGKTTCTLTRTVTDKGRLLEQSESCSILFGSFVPGSVSSHDLNCAGGATGKDCQDKLGDDIGRDKTGPRPSQKNRD